MGANSVLSYSSYSSHLIWQQQISPTPTCSSATSEPYSCMGFVFSSTFRCLSSYSKYPRLKSFPSPSRSSLLRPCALIIDDEVSEKCIAEDDDSLHQSPSPSSSSTRERVMFPKIDRNGRFCSPIAARELALSILYAACLEGSDPVRLFEKRLNVRREHGYGLDKAYLIEYNHMSFGGPPVTEDTSEEADELQRQDDKESLVEAEVLAAPLKLVYSKLILSFTGKLLVAVVENWDSHVLVIDKIAPPNWKKEAAGKILEFSILHLAMSEIAVLGTRHQIVINEAVDLAKRFCDGAAPRVINGCLRTFVKDIRAPRKDQ